MRRDDRLVALSLVVALAQISFLTWVIAGRAEILRDGQEIALRVHPVDPRDLLRGDYVRLGYDISSIPVSLIEDLPSDLATTRAGPIYVRIKKAEDGYWHAVSASLYEPASAAEDDGTVELRGQVAAGWSLGPDASLSVDYGIERFYLPEGEGRAIEQDMRTRAFGIRLAVASDGTAQIKALMDGETTLYEEPLY